MVDWQYFCLIVWTGFADRYSTIEAVEAAEIPRYYPTEMGDAALQILKGVSRLQGE